MIYLIFKNIRQEKRRVYEEYLTFYKMYLESEEAANIKQLLEELEKAMDVHIIIIARERVKEKVTIFLLNLQNHIPRRVIRFRFKKKWYRYDNFVDKKK